MRERKTRNDVTLQAISGTHVVLLGMDATDRARQGLLGFAIRRTDLTEHERYWLRGMKTFEETIPNPIPGQTYPTYEHPIQSFQWADYTAKPDHEYIYEIVPMYGKPKFLEEHESVSVKIATESETDATHAIFFNRGVAASQAYAQRFQNRRPDEVPNREAYRWLSRGLEEAILGFISQASGNRFGLRAAVYEFDYEPVLEAFKEVHEAGADVCIVYDGRDEDLRSRNEAAIRNAGIGELVKARTANKSYISHNKFIVLLKDGQAVAVWTGSTNFTKGGIFGQSNVGHLVRDKKVAQAYLDYWIQLEKDVEAKELRIWIEDHTADPQGPPKPNTIVTLFSPRKTLNVLQWYADQLDAAVQSAHFTAAFGVNPVLADILHRDKQQLRYLLLEQEGKNRDVYGADPDVQIAVGSTIQRDVLYSWTREVLTGFNKWVKYIHTKYLLIDPLSATPIVITGSANFSGPSTRGNDENMLVITGNERVAHIYLGEFMRLFSHYYFRDLMRKQRGEQVEFPRSMYLRSNDTWTNPYYQDDSIKYKKRLLFSG
jgi:phosphatidylserine/phosphatidylglycerophosphate/cardiolipin synthase-like enzyme